MSTYRTVPCQKLIFSTTLPHIFDFPISETYLFPQNFCWSRWLLFGLSQARCLPSLRLLKPTQVSGSIIIVMIMKKMTMIIIIIIKAHITAFASLHLYFKRCCFSLSSVWQLLCQGSFSRGHRSELGGWSPSSSSFQKTSHPSNFGFVPNDASVVIHGLITITIELSQWTSKIITKIFSFWMIMSYRVSIVGQYVNILTNKAYE